MKNETKLCPFCGGEILAVAKKCKHCGKWLTEETTPQNETHKSDKTLWIICVVFVLICAIVLIVRCGTKNDNLYYPDDTYEGVQEITSIDDEVNDAVAEEIVIEDDVTSDVEESIFCSPDLSTLFLHGNVQKMVEYEEDSPEYKSIYTFDMDGRLVAYKNKNDFTDACNTIIREGGRINCLGEQESSAVMVTEFGYNTDGVCISLNCYSGHGYNKYVYTTFDSNGWPTFAKKEGSYCHMGDEEEWSGQVTISYPSCDSNGNWTKCVYNEKEVVTTMTYDEDDNEVENKESRVATKVIVREIYYF